MSSKSSQSPGIDESDYNFQGSTSSSSDSTLNESVVPPRDKAVIGKFILIYVVLYTNSI